MSTVIVKIIVLCVILLFILIWFFKKRTTIEIKEYLLSLYLVNLTIPLLYPVIKFEELRGAWTIVYLGVWNIILLILLFLPKVKNTIKKNNHLRWWLLLLLLAILSLFNPANSSRLGTLIGIYYLIWFIISLIIIYQRYEADEIFSAMWKSFTIILFIQGIFTLAYPLFNIVDAVVLFKGEDMIEMATRGGRASAVGTFGHPSNLGLIMSFLFVYFTIAYFMGIKKKHSLFYIIISFLIIILTKSRTNIALAFFSFIFIYLLSERRSIKKIFFKTLYITPIVLLIVYVLVSSTDFGKSLFLSEDFQLMGFARYVHWIMGWNVFINNPILGVGLNSHLYYLSDNLVIIPGFYDWQYEFFLSNPIHNTHLIVLGELGILGGILWIYGFFSIAKKNIKLYNILYTNDKKVLFSIIFTLMVLYLYFFYAFTGWTTTHYYVICFMIVFIIYNQKVLSNYG